MRFAVSDKIGLGVDVGYSDLVAVEIGDALDIAAGNEA